MRGWPNEFDEKVMFVVILLTLMLAFGHFLADVYGVL